MDIIHPRTAPSTAEPAPGIEAARGTAASGGGPDSGTEPRPPSDKVRRMTSDAPDCPECRQPMESGGLVLSGREDDNRRACRALWRCPERHIWWNWADRPDEPLDACPVPELFR